MEGFGGEIQESCLKEAAFENYRSSFLGGNGRQGKIAGQKEQLGQGNRRRGSLVSLQRHSFEQRWV